MPVVAASMSWPFALKRSVRKRWPWMRSAPTRSTSPIVRMTTGSPTYARHSGVNGSPWVTDEKMLGSLVESISEHLLLNSGFCTWPVWSLATTLAGARSRNGSARRLIEAVSQPGSSRPSPPPPPPGPGPPLFGAMPGPGPPPPPPPPPPGTWARVLLCSHTMYSRKLPDWPTPTDPPDVFQMSTIVPLLTTAPVLGSWYVDPAGSITWAPNRPWPHERMPKTWSCQNTVPESTSENQRYWTNSTPAGSPDAWAWASGAASVSVVPLIAAIFATSMSGRPWPIAMPMPGRSRAVLVTLTVVAPAAAAAASVRFSVGNGRIDCSNERPVMTPSEAWGSNCTKCVCMLTLELFPFSALSTSWLDSVIATQSPTLERMASGSAGLLPLSTACLSWLRTKISPLGSTSPADVSLMASVIAVML